MTGGALACGDYALGMARERFPRVGDYAIIIKPLRLEVAGGFESRPYDMEVAGGFETRPYKSGGTGQSAGNSRKVSQTVAYCRICAWLAPF